MFWVCVLYTPLSSMATPSLFPLSCSFRRSILGSGELFYLICVVLHSSSAPFLFSSLPFPLSPFPTNPWGLKGAGARDWVCSTIYETFAQFPGVPAPWVMPFRHNQKQSLPDSWAEVDVAAAG